MTHRERILDEVNNNPGRTATEIARSLQLSVDSVASLLLLMWRKNQVSRSKNESIKGRGFEYFPHSPTSVK